MLNGDIANNFFNLVLLDYHQGIKVVLHGAVTILKLTPIVVKENKLMNHICRIE